jgi:hypothetical protein
MPFNAPLFYLWFRVPVILALLIGVAQAAGLNDTGVTSCYGDVSIAPGMEADIGTHPRQDCRYGRDPANTARVLTPIKVGAGSKAFDYTKIANDGTAVSAGAALNTGLKDWACTRDNVTGLIWEVKTGSGLRSASHTYTWYSSDSATNGGIAGEAGSFVVTTCATVGSCDTEKFVAEVNATALCGASNWRLPTKRELDSIVDYGRLNSALPPVDSEYFPNTLALAFWSGSADPVYFFNAWTVELSQGKAESVSKGVANRVRLVRTP